MSQNQASPFRQAVSGKKFVFKGRLVRAHVMTPFDYKNKGNPKFSTYLIVNPNDPKVVELLNLVNGLKQNFFPNLHEAVWKSPIQDARNPQRPDGSDWQEWMKGHVFIACSTGVQYPPIRLVKANTPTGVREATLSDEAEFFYDGADAALEVGLGSMEGDRKGVNLYFNSIVALGTGERMLIPKSGGSFNAAEVYGEFLQATGNVGNYQQPNHQPAQQQQQPNQYQGNGYAPQGTQQYGSQGDMQGAGYQNPSSNGQSAQPNVYHSNNGYNQQPVQQPNQYQPNQYQQQPAQQQQPNQGYGNGNQGNGYGNGGGSSLV